MELDFITKHEPSSLSSVAIWHAAFYGISLKWLATSNSFLGTAAEKPEFLAMC